jgi:hypothetical protein
MRSSGRLERLPHFSIELFPPQTWTIRYKRNQQLTFMKNRTLLSLRNLLWSVFFALVTMSFLPGQTYGAAKLAIFTGVELQPLSAQVNRLIEAMDYLGSPFGAETRKSLEAAMAESNGASGVEKIQTILDPHCLFGVNINPEMRVKVTQGEAKPELVEQGWRQFLVKVQNASGTTAALAAVSPNAISLFESGSANTPSDRALRKRGETTSRPAADLWLDLAMFDKQPLRPTLSGLQLEYRIVQLYGRDAGKREGKISFNVGQGTPDLGSGGEADVVFNCLPAQTVTLHVLDENDRPTTAAFVIRDRSGRTYPSQAKRLAPDFAFHPQVYRADGETLKLPAGTYTVDFSRGPESVIQKKTIEVGSQPQTSNFKVERWIDPSKFGWWSGDHHIHAAGCAHYVKPTEGVHAIDMIRHCLGEDLKVGANLTWGPCFDYQKQFFCGKNDPVSQYPYLLRYDVEVSGFGSHESGHLVLLRLKDQIYPGGDSKNHWPKLCLNTLRWAKKQGAVCGPAHSGWGLDVQTDELPTFNLPKFDGIGANEYIVDVTHEVPGPDGKLVPAVDFISTVDTPYVWELNIWYHTLNAGFRTRISGETDFPCIYGERVGLGRSYVKQAGKLDYDDWCQGIHEGRNYVSDGKSHLMEFKVNNVVMGEKGSELKLAKPGSVRVTAKVAARLNEQPDRKLQQLPYNQKPYWEIERARIGDTREVPLELVVNGYPAAKRNFVADGQMRDVSFDLKIDRSSWVAIRILPSSHTNPIFVLVDGKPIRASRRSVQWCLDGVEQCWSQKERFIMKSPIKGELEDAQQAYAHAREVYKKLLSECEVD